MKITLPILSAILLNLAPLPAFAGSAGLAIEIPDIENAFGIAVGFVPDYSGSDETIVGIAPTGIFHWGETDRYIKLVATELTVNAIDSKKWNFGPLVNYRFGRSNVEDSTVKLMDDVEDTVEAGVFLSWSKIHEEDPRLRLNISGQIQADVGGEHEGMTATLSARYWRPVSKPLTLSIGVSTTYADDNYTDTYYGVNAKNSTQSGLSIFSPSGGAHDVRVSPMAIFSLSQNWHVGAGVLYSRLLGDAADTPIVKDRGDQNQLMAGIGLIYAW